MELGTLDVNFNSVLRVFLPALMVWLVSPNFINEAQNPET